MLSKGIHNVNIDASNTTYSELLLTSVVTKLQYIELNGFREPLDPKKHYRLIAVESECHALRHENIPSSRGSSKGCNMCLTN